MTAAAILVWMSFESLRGHLARSPFRSDIMYSFGYYVVGYVMVIGMDFLAETGTLALGSRLRRLSDRLMPVGAGISRGGAVEFKPAWFPTFNFLYRRGATPVGQIAQELGVTHVSIIQVLQELESKGLAQSAAGADRRVRMAELSADGMELAGRLEDIWACIRQSIDEAIGETGHDLLDAVNRMELCLDRKSFLARFKENWADTVEITPFSPENREAFREINIAWIEEHFVVEPIDERVLSFPETEILEKGGSVIYARDRRTGEILGACALMKQGEEWELAKMGVRSSARGRGIGFKLGEAILGIAREMGLSKVVLETNSKLRPAIQLYRKLGFVHVTPMAKSDYARSDVKMEIVLR